MPAEQAMDIDLLTLPEVRKIYRERMKNDFPENELKSPAMIEKLILEFPKGEPHTRTEAGEFYSRIYRSFVPEWIFEQMVTIPGTCGISAGLSIASC